MAAPHDPASRRYVLWSVISLVVLTLVTLLVGFVWLPSAHPDFTRAGHLGGHLPRGRCPDEVERNHRARESARLHARHPAGRREKRDVASRDRPRRDARAPAMHDVPRRAGRHRGRHAQSGRPVSGSDREAVGRLQERGPRAFGHAGPGGEPRGRRHTQPCRLLRVAAQAAARTTADDSPAPALVRVGDPVRNIAPCASCHGGIDRKLGTPWLENMPKRYLEDQLHAFATGARRNDIHAQMRNVVRQMTKREIAEVSEFYARRGMPTGHR